MPTNQDDDHADYLLLKGAYVGVGWNPMLGRPIRFLLIKTQQMRLL